MVDTGAVRSIIPAHVMEALGLMSPATGSPSMPMGGPRLFP